MATPGPTTGPGGVKGVATCTASNSAEGTLQRSYDGRGGTRVVRPYLTAVDFDDVIHPKATGSYVIWTINLHRISAEWKKNDEGKFSWHMTAEGPNYEWSWNQSALNFSEMRYFTTVELREGESLRYRIQTSILSSSGRRNYNVFESGELDFVGLATAAIRFELLDPGQDQHARKR